jgi:hypothetical protein
MGKGGLDVARGLGHRAVNLVDADAAKTDKCLMEINVTEP